MEWKKSRYAELGMLTTDSGSDGNVRMERHERNEVKKNKNKNTGLYLQCIEWIGYKTDSYSELKT